MAAGTKIVKCLEVVLTPGGIRAILTWPKFSVASFKMLSNLARQGISPRTVIDVGANVGQFAVAAAMIFPRIELHSFEPIPECVSELRHNTRALSCINIYPFALGERSGRSRFIINSHSQSSSILALAKPHLEAFPHEREARTIDVEMNTLDAVFNEKPLASPILLKLDVQGYEANTILGGLQTLKRCDYVVLEASLRPMYQGELCFTEILSLMMRNGFEFLRPVGWLADDRTGEIVQFDALFQRVKTEEQNHLAENTSVNAE